MPRLLAFLSLGVFLAFVAGCSRSPLLSLPEPGQPAALVAEARALAASHAASFIDERDWPPSIRALHPVTVEVAPPAVIVTLVSRTGVGAWGYVAGAAEGGLPGRARFTLHPTADPALWRFEWRP